MKIDIPREKRTAVSYGLVFMVNDSIFIYFLLKKKKKKKTVARKQEQNRKSAWCKKKRKEKDKKKDNRSVETCKIKGQPLTLSSAQLSKVGEHFHRAEFDNRARQKQLLSAALSISHRRK